VTPGEETRSTLSVSVDEARWVLCRSSHRNGCCSERTIRPATGAVDDRPAEGIDRMRVANGPDVHQRGGAGDGGEQVFRVSSRTGGNGAGILRIGPIRGRESSAASRRAGGSCQTLHVSGQDQVVEE